MKMERKKIVGITAVVAVAAALALGAVTALATVAPRVALAHGGFGFMGGRGGFGGGDSALAAALGITTEELQAAHEKARDAAIDQAASKGQITEDQADALKDGDLRGFGRGGPALRGFAAEVDKDALLAEALGISVEKLQQARDKAFETTLQAALDADRITETQAEAARARYALGKYLRDQGVDAKARGVYQDAIKGAVSAGVITQEQADQLQSGPGLGGFGHHGFGGFGGHGMHHGFGRGFGGPGFGRGFEDRAAPGTDGSSNGTASPAPAPSGFDL